MRIGIEALAIDNQSGSGIYTHQLLSALPEIDRRNEYHVFVPYGFKDLPDSLLEAENFRLHPVRLCHRALRPFWTQTVLPLRARSLRLDVLHSTQFSAPVWGSTPLVVTIHDVIYTMFPETIRRTRLMYYRSVVPRVALRARLIVTDSKGARKDIIEAFGIEESKVKAIPLAASDEFDKPISQDDIELVRERHSLPQDYLLTVGTLEPRKNLTTLIEAFLKVAPQMPSAHLVIVGRPGWGYESLLARCDGVQTLRGRIKFLGFVPREDLPAIYQLASAFAFPSLHEGFGLPLLEAMKSGTSVVASGIPTSLELLKDEGTGLVVEPTNVDEWAHAIEDLLKDRELAQCLAQNGKRTAKQYSWKRTAESTLAVYEKAGQMSREVNTRNSEYPK